MVSLSPFLTADGVDLTTVNHKQIAGLTYIQIACNAHLRITLQNIDKLRLLMPMIPASVLTGRFANIIVAFYVFVMYLHMLMLHH